MAVFTVRAVLSDLDLAHGFGITDLRAVELASGWRLVAGSATDGGLTLLALTEGAAAQVLGELDATAGSGTYGLAEIEIAVIGGEHHVLPAGRYDDGTALIGFDGQGGLAAVTPLPTDSAPLAGLTEVEVIGFGAEALLLAGRDGRSGLSVFSLQPGGLAQISVVQDSAALALANVSALVTLQTGQGSFAFVASSLEHGISSFAVSASGSLDLRDTVAGMKGYGIYRPTELATVTAAGRDFLIVGAAGSSSLGVFAIAGDGTLRFRDMAWDELGTRFRNVSALDTFTVGERAFVLAGGTDGGMTLFELGPDGHLYVLTNVIDTATTTLGAVSAIEVVVTQGEIQVFVASGSEAGITQFILDLGRIGMAIEPFGAENDAVGSGADDFLLGTDARNTLWGLNGDDRIVDGGGIDTLYGGAGADVFVFVRDGCYDRIMDFEPRVDRIDLSGFPMIYSMAAFAIVPTAKGARIDLGWDSIVVESHSGGSLTAADFSAASFLF